MLGLGCLVAGVALTGCTSVLQGAPAAGGGNGGQGSAPYDYATGAEDMIVAIDKGGGYIPVQLELRNTVEFLLVGDGTAIAAAPIPEIFPGPAIYPLQSVTLTEDQIQELLQEADDAGLLGEEIEYGEQRISDMPETTVAITIGGRTVEQTAYALGLSEELVALDDAKRAARQALQEFIDTAQGMVAADSDPYVPSGVVAYRVKPGGEVLIDPEFEQLEPRPWPIATVPPPIEEPFRSSCVAITGPEAAVLLAELDQANEATQWVIGTEPPILMAFRPLLPGDPGC